MRKRKGFLGAAVALAALLGAGPASAQVTIAGSTVGCFSMSAALAGSCSGLNSAQAGLSFAGASFNTTSSALDGFFALGTNANPSNKLGTFALASSQAMYSDWFFHLFVTVTSPSGLSPSVYEFVGDLTGSVDAGGNGGVHVGYTTVGSFPGTGLDSGNGTFPGGSFAIGVQNTDVTPPSAQNPTGAANQYGSGLVSTTTVPEPMSMLLLGSGLAGVLGARRRRRDQPADA